MEVSMSEKRSIWTTTPNVPDADDLAKAWRRVFHGAVDAMFAGLERSNSVHRSLPFDPTAPARAFTDFAVALMKDPAALADAHMRATRDWTRFMTAQATRLAGGNAEPAITPARGDRRFSDPAWSDEAVFDAIKQAYLLAAQQMMDLVAGSKGLDDKTRARVDFYVRQYLYALSPANFPTTNPEAIRRTLEASGLNLLGGLANLLDDFADEDAWIRRRAADVFTLGKDLAATPGAVVYQNELIQLIQYAPATAETWKRPLLYVPPLVNKYYLMDLTPHSSFFKWLVDQGHTVFAISWINPGRDLADKDIADYVQTGVIAAIDKALEATGEDTLDLFGFCMGGSLAAMALGVLAETGAAEKVATASLIGTMIDYAELGEWSVFTKDGSGDTFDAQNDDKVHVTGGELKKLFSVVRANDLIWNSVVDHYLMDRMAPPSDLLHWFADGANMPGAFLKTWSRDILQANRLRQRGGLKIGKIALDMSKVTTPIFNLGLKDDHVSDWRAVWRSKDCLGGPVRFLLGGSGHNAGVINPPARGKHGYWVNDAGAETPEAWLKHAEKRDGSWWPEWHDWLTTGEHAQEKLPAPEIGAVLPAIEPAPGSYVRG
jgi:polyhydroxyalkanoate synthase subunit PhaC